MACPLKDHLLLSIVLLLNRVSLGAYFLLAGVAKVRGGIKTFYEESFLKLKPDWLPEAAAMPYGYALPVIEILLGLMLIIGLAGRVSAGLIALALLSFTIALAGAGIFWHNPPSVPGPYHTNVILLTLAILLTVTGPGSVSIDRLISRRRVKHQQAS